MITCPQVPEQEASLGPIPRARLPGLFAALALLPTAASPQESVPTAVEASLGISALQFDHREFADDGARVSRDEGTLPGLVAGLRAARGAWGISADLTYHAGKISHDGRTSVGRPFVSSSDEHITDFWIALERRFALDRPDRAALYAGLGQRRWDRTIRASAGVAGLAESYRWHYALAGVKTAFAHDNHARWVADLRLTRPLRARVEVDFGALFDPATLDLPEKAGMRASLAWQRKLAAGHALSIETYVQRWRTGRSETRTLSRNGVAVGSVFEPRATTDGVGVNLSWSWGS